MGSSVREARDDNTEEFELEGADVEPWAEAAAEPVADRGAHSPASEPQARDSQPSRVSVPPPLPPEVRRGERSAVRAPETRSAVRAPETRAEGSAAATRSGTFRIDADATIAGTPTSAATQRQIAQERTDREQRALVARLRLGLKLRDDRVAALENELARLRARLAAAERATTPADDLRRITGIGPAFERALHQLGIKTYREIAAFTPEDVTRVADALGAHRSRVEPWVVRARELAAG